jgi:hypothetical protein
MIARRIVYLHRALKEFCEMVIKKSGAKEDEELEVI